MDVRVAVRADVVFPCTELNFPMSVARLRQGADHHRRDQTSHPDHALEWVRLTDSGGGGGAHAAAQRLLAVEKRTDGRASRCKEGGERRISKNLHSLAWPAGGTPQWLQKD